MSVSVSERTLEAGEETEKSVHNILRMTFITDQQIWVLNEFGGPSCILHLCALQDVKQM